MVKTGGVTWSRTKIVYPEGSDLQSEDAHAIASITPYILLVLLLHYLLCSTDLFANLPFVHIVT